VDVLSHPRVQTLLSSQGIELRSFREVMKQFQPNDSEDLR
jgi:hypothetical protein